MGDQGTRVMESRASSHPGDVSFGHPQNRVIQPHSLPVLVVSESTGSDVGSFSDVNC